MQPSRIQREDVEVEAFPVRHVDQNHVFGTAEGDGHPLAVKAAGNVPKQVLRLGVGACLLEIHDSLPPLVLWERVFWE